MRRTWFELYLEKLCSRDKHCTTASLVKVPPLKFVVYLILEIYKMLFTDPTQGANERKDKCQKH